MMERQYKDSGIEWIGRIPDNWRLSRFQSQIIEINEKNYPIKSNDVLSLTIKDGVIPYEEKGEIGNKAKENIEEYKLAYPNTIVLNSMNILIGAVGICKWFGCISPVYYVFKNTDKSDLRYINYIVSSEPFQKFLRRFANGILEIRLRVSATDILKRMIPTPPLSEQQRIASYLDKKCGEIDALIALQEKMIAQLTEYKQAVITEAVTKGLDPNAKLVSSGIEWIGDVPEGWKVCKLKSIVSNIESGVSVNAGNIPAKESEVGVLKTSAVSRFVFNAEENKTVNDEEKKKVSCPVKAKTIIVSRMNTPELVGACGYVEKDYDNLFLPDRLWQVHFNDGLFIKYIWYALRSSYNRNYYSSLSVGSSSSMQNISQDQFLNAKILLPPLSDQQRIATYLDTKCSEIDSLITLKRQKIESLNAYKKSIIYEAVTGKTIIK